MDGQKKQMLDIKQILEQRGSKCTCRVIMRGGGNAKKNDHGNSGSQKMVIESKNACGPFCKNLSAKD